MHFAYPSLLLLLLIPAGLVWWTAGGRGTQVRMPFDNGQSAPRPWLTNALRFAGAMPAIVLAVAIMLLARPQQQVMGETVRDVRNIQLLVDVSGSMMLKYGHSTRYQSAMAATPNFVHHRTGDEFALTVFGADVFHWLPLTKDASGFDCAEPFLDPRKLPERITSGTYIGKALMAVKKKLDEVGGDRTIILLTDGESDDLGVKRTTDIGNALAADHITVFSIFIGQGESSYDIGRIATRTGGRLFTPDNPEALNETFHHIDAMQPVQLKPVTRNSVDAMNLPLAIGIAAVSLTLLMNFGLRYTPW